MCFFLRTSFLLRIAGGGAAPSPLHPPTRFYCVTFAPWYLLLFRLLFPSASTFFFLCASFFVLLAWYIFRNRRPLVLTPIPFAFGISINDLGSYVLLSLYFFLGTHCGGRRCALPPASPHPLLLCNLCPLVPTPLPFACSISINDFFFLCASFFVLLAWYIFHNRRPLVLTPIPFAFGISINDLGSYVRLSLYFFLGTHCGGRRCASLVPSCHEHRLVEFSLLFLIYINFHGDYFLRASFLVRIAGGGAAHHMVSFVEIEESKPPVGCTVFTSPGNLQIVVISLTSMSLCF